MLDAADLGEMRTLRELDARLNAMETKLHRGIVVGEFEDNGTRMRATELLADIHRMRATDINLHTDSVEIIPAPKPEEQQPDED